MFKTLVLSFCALTCHSVPKNFVGVSRLSTLGSIGYGSKGGSAGGLVLTTGVERHTAQVNATIQSFRSIVIIPFHGNYGLAGGLGLGGLKKGDYPSYAKWIRKSQSRLSNKAHKVN